jgi:beta-glucosidase
MRSARQAFPASFRWGAATSSWQVEGGAGVDGMGPSVWDAFTTRPGAVYRDHHHRSSADHYHRLAEDVALMRELRLQAYRFSVAWPRVLPEGTGTVNEAGLAFYDRLVDGLLAAGIEPWLTLHHWDLPWALYQRGGWLNPDSPRWFADYVEVVLRRVGDRVRHVLTFNEPQTLLMGGYGEGWIAPGDRWGPERLVPAAHHMLRAHGAAVDVARARCPSAQVGMSIAQGATSVPATPDAIDAARRHHFALTQPGRCLWQVTWWMDAAALGRYPADGLAHFERHLPAGWEADLPRIARPCDLLAATMYWGDRIDANGAQLVPPPGSPQNHYHWDIDAGCLEWGPRWLAERYGLPIVIAENGMSNADWLHRDGAVHDPQRIDFLANHLEALARAVAAGVDVRGYFHWSFLDNFELHQGYKHRFGLVHVDFATGTRTIKDSGRWYARWIANTLEDA